MNMNAVTKFAAVALTTIFLLILAALMDGPSDTQAAQDVADEAEYAAALADGGAAKCGALGRNPKWTPDGNLICMLPKAERPMLKAEL